MERRGKGSNQYRDRPPERPQIPVSSGELRSETNRIAKAGPLAVPQRIVGTLTKRDLSGMDLRDLLFVGTPAVHKVRFDHADLSGHPGVVGTFTHCSFGEVVAPSANLDGFHVATMFAGAAFPLATLPSATDSDFDGVNAELAVGPRRNFDHTRWPGARLRGARFTQSTFRAADLSAAIDIEFATFRGCAYDQKTLFPSGYKPGEHGWMYLPYTDEEIVDLRELRAAAESGTMPPYGQSDG